LPAGRSRDRDRFSHGSDVPYDYVSQIRLMLLGCFVLLMSLFLTGEMETHVCL